MAAKRDGSLKTAPEDAGNANHCERSTFIYGEERQPSECVVDQVIDSRIDGCCTLYRVRGYRRGLTDGMSGPPEQLPLYFVVQYEYRLCKTE